MATHMDVQVEGVTDPIDGFNNTKAAPSAPEYGPDSDDETLRFEEDDDLYASDADEADAKWVRKQHRPATQCEEQGDGREGIADCWRSQGDVESSWGDSEESDSDPVLENGEEEDGIGGVHGEGRAPVKENTQNKMKNKKKATAGIAAGMGIVSDAQLSCPLCFTTVCLECQRHARYHTQFRAVSAMNVVVRDDVSLCLDDISGQRKKKKKQEKWWLLQQKRGVWSKTKSTIPPACCRHWRCRWRCGGWGGERWPGQGGRGGIISPRLLSRVRSSSRRDG
ncbi:unnamed protein product [Sphacelaria rigidula]